MQTNRRALARRTPIALAIATFVGSAAAAERVGVPVGPAVQVNDTTAGYQGSHDVARAAGGEFAVVYFDEGGAPHCKLRLFHADGRPQGAAQQVDDVSGGCIDSRIAMDADGNFVVAWDSRPSTGDIYQIRARLYDAEGTPRAPSFQVDQETTTEQLTPNVAMNDAGEFVVAWTTTGDGHQSGIAARRYAASGAPRGRQFQVNQLTAGYQFARDIAISAQGTFMVVWDEFETNDVHARHYDRTGTPLGNQFVVTATLLGNPAVAMTPQGAALVVWRSAAHPNDLRAQRYAADGTPAGSDFSVADGGGYYPQVAIDADGDFTVAWDAYDQIHARSFTGGGTRAKPEQVLTGPQDRYMSNPAIAMDADGDPVVAWQGGEFGSEVYARRLAGSENVDLALTMSDTAAPVAPGATLTYDLTVTNTHPAAARAGVGHADGVTVTLDLPAGATFGSASGAGWSCSGTASLACALDGPLLPGAFAALSVQATAPETGCSLPAQAHAAGAQFDRDRGDDAAQALLVIDEPGTLTPEVLLTDFFEYGGTWGFQVLRSGGCSGAATLDVATVDGTALGGRDFGALATTLTWPHGDDRPRALRVPIRNDPDAEGPETFVVRLANASGAPLSGPAEQTITIHDDDTAGLVIDGPADRVLHEGGTPATYTVRLQSRPASPVAVRIGGGGQLAATPSPLRFGRDDWDLPQAVTLAAVDDNVTEFSSYASVRHTVRSQDPAYAALALEFAVDVVDNDVDDPPVAVDDAFDVVMDGGSVVLDVRANDLNPDGGETLVVTAVYADSAGGTASGSTGGTPPGSDPPGSGGGTVRVSDNGRAVIYRPAPGFAGTETFHYILSDGGWQTDAAVVTVTVAPAP